jgi:hypothetical protein
MNVTKEEYDEISATLNLATAMADAIDRVSSGLSMVEFHKLPEGEQQKWNVRSTKAMCVIAVQLASYAGSMAAGMVAVGVKKEAIMIAIERAMASGFATGFQEAQIAKATSQMHKIARSVNGN